MSEKLKPCPFCGTNVCIEKKPLWSGTRGYQNCYEYVIRCDNCGCRVRLEQNDTINRTDKEAEQNAVKAWNKRAQIEGDMTEFTKGKWSYTTYKERGSLSLIRLEAEGKKLCILYGLKEENEANARLIACAPELYDAVYGLLDYAYEALHWAGGKDEKRGSAPRIWREIQECQEILDRVNGK